jgi:predicted DNA-binding transcriptional regulator AlpA
MMTFQPPSALDVAMTSLDRTGLAYMLRVCTKTIDRRVDDGTFPKPDFHIGRQPRWKLATMLAWMETSKTI